MASCAICKTSYRKQVRMYAIPTNEFQRQQWLRACDLKEFSKYAKICALHFKESDFNVGKRRRLFPDVVPTRELQRPLIPPPEPALPVIEKSKPKPILVARFYDVVFDPETTPKPKTTCALVKVTQDQKEYTLCCSFCKEEFLLWNWAKFICHMKEKHPNASTQQAESGSNKFCADKG